MTTGPRTPTGKQPSPTPMPTSTPMPMPMPTPTAEWADRIRVGTSSPEALAKATGGKIERMGRRSIDNIFMLNLDGRRLVYARLQDQGGPRSTAYRTSNLHRVLDPTKHYRGHQIDHVGSTAIEGGRMGHRYALLAMVPRDANQSAGSTNEKGPAPVREFNKLASAAGVDYVSPVTREMQRKLIGRLSDGRGHSLRTIPLTQADLSRFSDSLLQNTATQERLAALANKGQKFDKLEAARKSQRPTPTTPRQAAPARTPTPTPPAASKTTTTPTSTASKPTSIGTTSRSGPSRSR